MRWKAFWWLCAILRFQSIFYLFSCRCRSFFLCFVLFCYVIFCVAYLLFFFFFFVYFEITIHYIHNSHTRWFSVFYVVCSGTIVCAHVLLFIFLFCCVCTCSLTANILMQINTIHSRSYKFTNNNKTNEKKNALNSPVLLIEQKHIIYG